MRLTSILTSATALLLLPSTTSYAVHKPQPRRHLQPRQLPDPATNVTTIQSPNGFAIRYKEPGQAGVCETTPGVNSYSGYVDLSPDLHIFFYFFEARHDPASAPITLWLNGGPGSDSLIGLFQELGPCSVQYNGTYSSVVNPYSWTNYSNMIFISQPVGVGFSYGHEEAGSQDPYLGEFRNSTEAPVNGRYAVINATEYDTTELAAVAVYEVLQAFYSLLPQLDPTVTSKEFNLMTESYGGHYGPVFFSYLTKQNAAIANGTQQGVQLNFNALGIGNGIIDESVQADSYLEFAVNNTYGIKSYNDTVYSYGKFANIMPNGCQAQIQSCRDAVAATSTDDIGAMAVCSEAGNMCRDNVEGLYYSFSGRGVYDIRHPYQDPTPGDALTYYLNLASTQQALGVDLNYTSFSNNEISFAFQSAGEYVLGTFIQDLQNIVDSGTRVLLYHGDADYICNWFGGEKASLALNYSGADTFRSAGYNPFSVNGSEYGEVREAGNFSFVRIYEAGHEVPYYQPLAALEMFRRLIQGNTMADGSPLNPGFVTNSTANATHTEAFVPLPTTPVPITQTTFEPVTGTSGSDTGTFTPTTFDPFSTSSMTASAASQSQSAA